MSNKVEVTQQELDQRVKALPSAKSITPGYADRINKVLEDAAAVVKEIQERAEAEIEEARSKSREAFNGVWKEVADAMGYEGEIEGKLSLWKTEAGEEIAALWEDIDRLKAEVRLSSCDCPACKLSRAVEKDGLKGFASLLLDVIGAPDDTLIKPSVH